ncbi:MAG: cold shock domain-containing protein [Planctomycetales bacterium]
MTQGTIKKLVSDKGFGFITPSQGGNDIFFHMSAVSGTDFAALQVGQSVSFDVDDSNDRGKGPRAANVRVS